MSYTYAFYAVDLDRIQQLFGSGDSKFSAQLLRDRGKDSSGFKAVLDAIISGEIDTSIEPAGYGYVLKAICDYLGEQIGCEVADVRDHPYESQLAASGPPIPIPYDDKNFPQIGFIRDSDIAAELQRIDSAPAPSGKLKKPGKRRGGTAAKMAEAIADDIASYRETLEEAQEKGCSIVAFRH